MVNSKFKETIILNYNKIKNSKFIFITGLPGSGKSTLGRELSKKYKLKYIELDLIEKELVDKYGLNKIKKLPEIEFWDLYYEYSINKYPNGSVIEGVQVLNFDFSLMKKYVIIAFKPNILKSSYRAIKREVGTDGDVISIKFVKWLYNNLDFVKYLEELIIKIENEDSNTNIINNW